MTHLEDNSYPKLPARHLAPNTFPSCRPSSEEQNPSLPLLGSTPATTPATEGPLLMRGGGDESAPENTNPPLILKR